MSGGNATQVDAEAEVIKLIDRLKRYRTAYVARPEGRVAALVLAMKGYVATEEGQGADAGLLIVRRTFKFAELEGGRPVAPPRGGGDVA